VVTAEAIKAEIAADAALLVAGRQLGDAQPLGKRAKTGDVRIHCAVCGATNTFRRFSLAEEHTCRHGDHIFVPYWNG
jgi:hypothetical protein